MATLVTVADVIRQQNAGQPILLALANQGHFGFQINGANAVLSAPNPLAPSNAGSNSPVSNAGAQAVPLLITAAGLVNSTARGQQFQIDINFGTTLAPAIASTGLISIPLGAGAYQDNWGLQVEGMWDATSQNFRGIYYGWVGASQVAQAPVNGSPKASALSGLQFTCAATLPGPTIDTTSFTLTEFSLDIA